MGRTLATVQVQVNKKSIEVEQLLSLELASNIQEKELIIPKTIYSYMKKGKL